MVHVRNSRSPRPPAAPRSPAERARPARLPNPDARRGKASAHIPQPAPALPGTPNQRRTPRQRRAEDTVQAILGAASRLLVERGYASVSTNAIAHLAGVSVGSLYQYFHDKEDVFRAVVRQHRQQVLPVIENALSRMREQDADIVELSLELLRQLAQVNRRDPHLLAAIERELGWLEHEEDDRALAIQDDAAQIIRARYPDHSEPEVAATLLVTTLMPLSRWIVHSRPASIDTERFIAAVGRMLSGLLEAP